MKDLRVELFNFKRTLNIEDTEVSNIVETHLANTTYFSELELINSLNEKLHYYTYNQDVKSLLESLNADVAGNVLSYNLKNLYQILNRKEGISYLETPIKTILEIINTPDETLRISRIFNELAIYDYVPEIKQFVVSLTSTPQERNNLLSSGKAEDVYVVVECVGYNEHIAFVKDSWFHVTSNKIEKTLLETHIKDLEKLKVLKNLEIGMKHSFIQENRINFILDNDLLVGIGENGKIFLNETEMNEEATLESLFNTAIIDQMYSNYYPIIRECMDNFDKFVNFDIVKKVTNLTKPYLELFVFNLPEGKNYVYNCDSSYNGYAFYEYNNVVEILHEVQNELNYDITYFFENKISNDLVELRKLNTTEKEINIQLEKVDYNLDRLKISIEELGNDEILIEAMSNLEKRKNFLNTKLKETLISKENLKVRK